MINFDEAFKLVITHALPLRSEIAPLKAAQGRILAEPVIASCDAPPADASAMDGYAVRADDCKLGNPILNVTRENFAGTADAGRIDTGECARIFTGAPLPAGADRIVIQENVRRDGNQIIFEGTAATANHIRTRGNDFAAGDALLARGTKLGPRQMVAAAAADSAAISCYAKPRVHLFVTGDELRAPGSSSDNEGTVPESVSFGLSAMIEQWGGEACGFERLPDLLETMQAAAARAANQCDLIIIAGGASVGERDYAKEMFAPLGMKLVFSKVAMKPGKPVWFGKVGQSLVMGLPGNPTSAMVTARLLLAPLLAGLSGQPPQAAARWQKRILAGPLASNGSRECYVRAILDEAGEVHPVRNQSSGAQLALAQADLLIRRQPDAGALDTGTAIDALTF